MYCGLVEYGNSSHSLHLLISLNGLVGYCCITLRHCCLNSSTELDMDNNFKILQNAHGTNKMPQVHHFYCATLCISMVFAVASVRPSICHVCVFYPDG